MREFTVHAPAKLNLYLDVLEKRPDGYHNIETLFEKIDLKDEIIVKEKARGRGIDVKVEPLTACPSGKDNIAHKALGLLFKKANVNIGLEIIIKKRIPSPAGLGGGSSDAACLLRSVNEAFDLGLSFKELFSLAIEIGADVPFFIEDCSFAIGKAKGEELEPVETEASFSHVIIKPDVSISTAEMYRRWNKDAKPSRKNNIKEIITAIKKKDLASIKKNYYNIFERLLGDHSQDIEKAKALLSQSGAGPGFLSGSGPSVFCILKDREEAMEIADKIPKRTGLKVFVATTCRN